MSIRTSVFLFIFVIFIILIGATYFIARTFFLNNLNDAEEFEMTRLMGGIEAIIQREHDALDAITVDWGSWDATYEFIEDLNQDYIDENILPGTFIDLDIDFITYIVLSGEIVYGAFYDAENEEMAPLPGEVDSYLSGNDFLLDNSEGGRTGYVLLSGSDPVLIASRPVLPSFEDQSARGLLIFGKYIDDSWVEDIGIYDNADIELFSVNDTEAPDEVNDILGSDMLADDDITVRKIDADTIGAYLVLKDITGDNALAVTMTVPRDISQAGRSGVMYIMLFLGGIALITIGGSTIFAERIGLGRLKVIADEVDRIGVSGDITKRIDIENQGKKDELSILTTNINRMMSMLQDLYEKEAELSGQLETEMMKRVDFTRALVHELRTPLTPILTTSDMLLEEVEDEPLRSMLENIYKGAVRLNKRITELLDVTRGEVGGLEVNLSSVDPAHIIRETVAECEPVAAERKKVLHLEMPETLPNILADEDRIRQVITNLLDNACKYTSRGDTINIYVRTVSGDLVVEVQDHGPGIEEEDQEKLFDPYFRSKKDEHHAGGLGLGLPLCKTIINLHNGAIWVNSYPGEGATFGFSIPLDTAVTGNKDESTGN